MQKPLRFMPLLAVVVSIGAGLVASPPGRFRPVGASTCRPTTRPALALLG